MDFTICLPDEILTCVIELTHEHGSSIYNRRDFHRLPSFLVCRRWYGIAIESPLYWQDISVVFPDTKIHVETFVLRLERAKRRPVALTFEGRYWPLATRMELELLRVQLMPALASHMDHIKSLQLRILQDPMMGIVLAALDVPAPVLVHLGIHAQSVDFISTHSTERLTPRNLFSNAAPVLRSLQLAHFHPPWSTNEESASPQDMPNWTRQITHLDLKYNRGCLPIVWHDVFPCIQELSVDDTVAVSRVYAAPGRQPVALRRVTVRATSSFEQSQSQIQLALPDTAWISVGHAGIYTVEQLTNDLVASPATPGFVVRLPTLKLVIAEAESTWTHNERFTVLISDNHRGRTREFTEGLALWSQTAPFYYSHPSMLPSPIHPRKCAPNELLSRFEVMQRVVELEASLYLLTKLAHHLPDELPVLKRVILMLTFERFGRRMPLDKCELRLKMVPIVCPLLEVVVIKDTQTYSRPRRVPLYEVRLLVNKVFSGSPQLQALNVELY